VRWYVAYDQPTVHPAPDPPDPPVVVIGASAGGVEALVKVVSGLDPSVEAAVVVVLHLPATGNSVLPDILRRAGSLPVVSATNGQPLEPGCIIVAPPDHHVLVKDGKIVLDRGPRENGSRPAADPLFRSAARARPGRVIGVVLSGALDDGVAGLRAIKDAGGVAVVQDPNDASTPSMPATALAHVPVDHVVPAGGLAQLLLRLVPEVGARPAHVKQSTDNPDDDDDDGKLRSPDEMPGPPSSLTCPECGGVMWEDGQGDLLRFRCHVGHSYSAESMLELHGDSVETALWTALRVLEERMHFLDGLADRQRKRGNDYAARGFDRQARAVVQRVEILRRAIARGETQAEQSEVAS
jgi:two-component system, chemotaxis family, protein-glutamate methylesterase/glutaminase